MKQSCRSILSLAVLATLTTWNASADEYEAPPAKEHSNITCTPTADPKDAESLADANFAKALHDALGDNGFHSLVITFAECFGGGMMDDVAGQFGASTKPTSMTSGSKHDETAGSKPSSGGAKDDGYSRWGESYRGVHPGKQGGVNKNPKKSQAYDDAKKSDSWKNANPKKTPQQKTLNNGGDIVLGDGTNGSGATSFHAILFAGNTGGRPDYWNNIVRQQQMLKAAGYPAGNITTLFDDGTAPTDAKEPADAGTIDKAGTRQNLLDAINSLTNVMNTNEQLYIFISDHGSDDLGGDTLAKVVTPSGTKTTNNTFYFNPLTPRHLAELFSTNNTSGPYLELNVVGLPAISPNYMVLLNNFSVNQGDNQLEPRGTNASFRFLVSPGSLSLTGTNEVWIANLNPSSPPINVELYLSMGDFGNVRDITSPTLAIHVLGSVVLLTFDTEPGIVY